MKRDWDVVRNIMLKLEELSLRRDSLSLKDFDESSWEIVSYHARLLNDAGLIEGQMLPPVTQSGPCDFVLRRLNWNGHDFLDAIRNDTIWQRTKDIFKERGVDMSFELIGTIAKSLIVNCLGFPAS